MSAQTNTAYAQAIAAVAGAEGELAKVQDEVFSLARTLGGSEELQTTLSDSTVPVARRQQIIEDLLANKVSKATLATV
ncbi:MAG: hypothetical protein HKN24_03115, partial [Acidimicrobiales bacterium]|nr:hypothetical protein [Acidimicrobiales bacterium]